jgi:hypothetical protein
MVCEVEPCDDTIILSHRVILLVRYRNPMNQKL